MTPPPMAPPIFSPHSFFPLLLSRDRIPTHVTEECHAPGGWCDSALDRIVGFHAPFPGTRVGINGINPCRQWPNGSCLPQTLKGYERCLTGPWLSVGNRLDLFVGFESDGGAPLDFTDHDKIVGGIVGWPTTRKNSRRSAYRPSGCAEPRPARRSQTSGGRRRGIGPVAWPGNRRRLGRAANRH